MTLVDSVQSEHDANEVVALEPRNARMSVHTQRGMGSLFVCCASIAALWLVVFPWLSTIPPFADHIRKMEEADIVVDAMFYTELNWQPPDGAAWRHE